MVVVAGEPVGLETAQERGGSGLDHTATHNGRDAAGRWLPGTSGNLDGRPSAYVSITAAIKRRIAERDDDGRLLADVLAEHFVQVALGKSTGSVEAMKVLLDRNDGPVKSKGEVLEQSVQRIIKVGDEDEGDAEA